MSLWLIISLPCHSVKLKPTVIVSSGLVEVIPWPLSRFLRVSRSWLVKDGPGDLHYFGQIPALNDCLYRYMYRSAYVALHDTDELILPQSLNR